MSVQMVAGRPTPQLDMASEKQHRKHLATVLQQLQRGQGNTNVIVTLDPSVATTTLIDARISIQTACLLAPMTANAAAAIPTTWVVPSAGTAVFHHASNAQVDRTFLVALIG